MTVRITRLLVVALLALTSLAACGDDDDDDDTAAGDGTDETITTGDTIGPADVEGAIPQEVCTEWAEWNKDGDSARLETIREQLVGIPAAEEIDEALEALLTMETETADQQAAYEGAYDFVNGELAAQGCPPSRTRMGGAGG